MGGDLSCGIALLCGQASFVTSHPGRFFHSIQQTFAVLASDLEQQGAPKETLLREAS